MNEPLPSGPFGCVLADRSASFLETGLKFVWPSEETMELPNLFPVQLVILECVHNWLAVKCFLGERKIGVSLNAVNCLINQFLHNGRHYAGLMYVLRCSSILCCFENVTPNNKSEKNQVVVGAVKSNRSAVNVLYLFLGCRTGTQQIVMSHPYSGTVKTKCSQLLRFSLIKSLSSEFNSTNPRSQNSQQACDQALVIINDLPNHPVASANSNVLKRVKYCQLAAAIGQRKHKRTCAKNQNNPPPHQVKLHRPSSSVEGG